MQTDEVLRLDYQKCIALFQGHKPALLEKLTPEELPDYATLKSCRVIDYIPEWKKREEQMAQKPPKKKTPPAEECRRREEYEICDFPDLHRKQSETEDLGMKEGVAERKPPNGEMTPEDIWNEINGDAE